MDEDWEEEEIQVGPWEVPAGERVRLRLELSKAIFFQLP